MRTKIKIAVEEANKSTHRQKVGAVIFNKKIIISKGHNYKLKSVRSITRKYIRYRNKIHAEIDAILKAKTDLKGTSILIVRVNNRGELRMARPCNHCMLYIDFVKIKNVFYSNKFGEIERI